ncbi:MAG: hypothetical protein ACON5B_12965 [Myxococcota bacterium]
MSDMLHERGKALEDLFFAHKDAERVAALQARAARDAQVHELTDVTGIHDADVLGHLVSLGVTADTLAALALVPVLHVAWSDRVLDANERNTLLLEAAEAGVVRGSVAHTLLESWLGTAYNADLFSAWADYWTALRPHMGADKAANMASGMIAVAERVARASGGFAGINAVSAAERSALAEIRSVLG